jgi:uncharacterized membrane protein
MTEHILNFAGRKISEPKRWISVIAGGALAAYGLKMRSRTGAALAAIGGVLVWRGATGICRDQSDSNVSVPYGKGIRVEESLTIDASAERIYAFWRNVENLPRFMHRVETVAKLDDERSHWIVRGPAGKKVEWDAEIINEVPNELIGWRSIDCSEVDHAGSVHFTPTTDGRTEVRVLLRYDPPAGIVGAKVAQLLGDDPALQVREDLRRLKTLMEGAHSRDPQ